MQVCDNFAFSCLALSRSLGIPTEPKVRVIADLVMRPSGLASTPQARRAIDIIERRAPRKPGEQSKLLRENSCQEIVSAVDENISRNNVQ